MSRPIHSLWQSGTAAERGAYTTTGLDVPFHWWETDNALHYWWNGSAWVTGAKGSGVVGRIAYWSDANTLTSDASLVYTAGGHLGIGVAANANYAGNFQIASTNPTANTVGILSDDYVFITTGSSAYVHQGFSSHTRVHTGNGTSQTGTVYGYLGGIVIMNTHAGATTFGIGLSSYNYIYANSAGTCGTMIGVAATFSASGANTLAVTEYDGVRIFSPSALIAIGTNYGIRIDDISTGSAANYAIATYAGNIVFNETGDANTDFRHEGDTNTHLLFSDAGLERIGINRSSPAGKLDVYQSSTSGAIPVLKLEQKDVSEEFTRYVGTAASGVLTQSIVDEGDQASETREGWLKIYVQDDGEQLADQAYYIPIYSLSA